MADITRTLADTSGFIPQAWAQRALDVLRNNIVLAKLVQRDTSYEPGWVGKQLNIPYPGTFTAQAKSENTAATVQVPANGATVSLTLTAHEYVDFIVEDWAQAQASSNLLDRYVQPAAIALAEKLETDLFGEYTNLTGTTVGTSGTDLASGVIRSARENLNVAKAPLTDRSLIISPKDEISILSDNGLAQYFAFQRGEAYAQGSIGRLYGFDVYMSQLVPVVAGTPNSTKCLAIYKDALMLATRPFRDIPAGAGVQTSQIMDEDSGLNIRVLYQYDINNRGMRVGFDILYGHVALRPTLGLVALT